MKSYQHLSPIFLLQRLARLLLVFSHISQSLASSAFLTDERRKRASSVGFAFNEQPRVSNITDFAAKRSGKSCKFAALFLL